MSGRSYYLVFCDDPEEILAKFRERFESPEAGEITQDNNLLFRSSNSREFLGSISEGEIEKDSFWYEVSEDIDKVIFIAWQDTSCITYGTLYKIRDEEWIELDHEYGDLHPFTGNEAEKLEDIDGPNFQAHSHVPAYFYRVHGLKIFDKYPNEISEINFEDTYNPESSLDFERTCPSCEGHNISVEGWEAECEDCGYRNTEVWFSQYSLNTARTHNTNLVSNNSSDHDKNSKRNQSLSILDKLVKVLTRND